MYGVIIKIKGESNHSMWPRLYEFYKGTKLADKHDFVTLVT